MMAMAAQLPPRVGPSHAALAEQTAALRPAVRALIGAMLSVSREHPDVEDLTHEALRRALEGHARLREGEPLRPWVAGIARHVALDALRARRRERLRRRPNAPDADAQHDSELDGIADPAPSPFERASTAERAERIAHALDALPAGPRDAIRLFHLEGLGYKDIAARLDVPVGTVATWVTRARAALASAVCAGG
jgi:RNA polymerase sigma-70 factor (ECF subfamily)